MKKFHSFCMQFAIMVDQALLQWIIITINITTMNPDRAKKTYYAIMIAIQY